MKIVLIIEDNLEIKENTTEILELAGFNVIGVDNGQEGIRAVLNSFPRLFMRY